MIGICKNGHMTGQRHCGQCGADREMNEPGDGRVLLAKHELPRQPEDWLRKLRRDTQIGSGAQGDNQINNVSYGSYKGSTRLPMKVGGL
jgi:hypothetical protein